MVHSFQPKLIVMKPESILQSDILDILFEGRNKDYGAYVLRRNYGKHLMYAIGAMSLTVAALIALSSVYKKPSQQQRLTDNFRVLDSIELVNIKLPDDPKPLKVHSPKRTADFTTPVITRDKIADTIPEVDQLLRDDIQIGLKASFEEGVDIGIAG